MLFMMCSLSTVVCVCSFLFLFKQKTAYEMRISDWSSDVCSSDLKEKWGRLTDDELDMMAGQRDQLIGRLQEHYGMAREEAEREADRWATGIERDRKSVVEGKSVSVRVDLGGRRIIKKTQDRDKERVITT